MHLDALVAKVCHLLRSAHERLQRQLVWVLPLWQLPDLPHQKRLLLRMEQKRAKWLLLPGWRLMCALF